MRINSIGKENFYKFIDENFVDLGISVTTCTEEAYRSAFSSEIAKKSKNIVYIFRSKNPIPRLVDQSNILYIGQTKNSFETRYLQYAKKHSEIVRNKKTIETYGPIHLSALVINKDEITLKEAENHLLWLYYCNHYEYPPFNYTRAHKPKSINLPNEVDSKIIVF